MRIEARVLTVRDVAAQLESQLGVKVIVMPALERCESTWEADGLEQTAGEVLSILEKDAPLIWGWYPQLEGEEFLGDAAIWLVESEWDPGRAELAEAAIRGA